MSRILGGMSLQSVQLNPETDDIRFRAAHYVSCAHLIFG